MPAQGWRRETRGGISGHGGPPGLYLLGEAAGWHEGLAIAAQLAWSGDSVLAVERGEDGAHMLAAWNTLQAGEAILQPGERLTTPELLLEVSTRGRNGAAQAMHRAVRARMRWPGGAMRPRPVHRNSWEACYFDHDEAAVTDLMTSAAALGVERFVLDDGWFRGRDDDTRALGDWTPDPAKYPRGLAPLADRARALVLDLRRAEVRDHLFGALDALLAGAPIRYLKWDHNRHLAPGGGAAQTRGLYALLERLRAAHPLVEIEGCAGGGGRSDAGLAAHVHRFWTSDNLDAVSRLPMQRGFLAFLPPETMGAHVGAVPFHGTGRV